MNTSSVGLLSKHKRFEIAIFYGDLSVQKRKSASTASQLVRESEILVRYVLCIPFIGKPSLMFKRKVTQLFKELLDVELRCVFQTTKVKDYFSLKCKTPDFLLSNVTYKFTCQGDPGLVYVGETARHVVKRAEEHRTIFTEKYPTAVGQHIQLCDTCQTDLKSGNLNWRRFEIIDKCKSKLECEVREAFLIQKTKPALNVQLYQSGAGVTLKIFN